MYHTVQKYPGEEFYQCMSYGLLKGVSNSIINVTFCVIGQIIPLITIGYCYYKIYVMTKSHDQQLSGTAAPLRRCKSQKLNDQNKNGVAVNVQVQAQAQPQTDADANTDEPDKDSKTDTKLQLSVMTLDNRDDEVKGQPSTELNTVSDVNKNVDKSLDQQNEDELHNKVMIAATKLVLLFFLTSLPYFSLSVYWVIDLNYQETINKTIYNLAFWSNYCNSAINPFLYGNILKSFKGLKFRFNLLKF